MNRLAELCKLDHKVDFIKYKIFLAAHNEKFFTAKLADFDYYANTIGAFLARFRDLLAFYDNSSAVEPRAKLVEKVPKCGNSIHEFSSVVQSSTKFNSNLMKSQSTINGSQGSENFNSLEVTLAVSFY